VKLDEADEYLTVRGEVVRVTSYVEVDASGDKAAFRDALHYTLDEWTALSASALKKARMERYVNWFNVVSAPPEPTPTPSPTDALQQAFDALQQATAAVAQAQEAQQEDAQITAAAAPEG
jgi:hypothetical protein